ncbi:MAG: hypothetical protein KJ737_15845 [Proteobacteria bacterium]|nr:hypothetical protein [Pseudomonadota bacterium]
MIVTKLPANNNSLDFSLLKELSPETIIHYLHKTGSVDINDINKIREFVFHKSDKDSDKNFFRVNRLIASIRGNSRILIDKYLLIPDMDVLHVPKLVKKVYDILNESEDNIIFTTSPTHSIHLAGYYLSKKGLPWVADFRDPWDHYPQKGHIELTNPIERWMEKKVIQKADAVISTTRTNTENLIIKHTQVDKNKFFTVTNSYDKAKVDIVGDNDPKKFIISYTGIFYADKDPFTFFRALRSWWDVLDHEGKARYEQVLRIQLIGSRSPAVSKIVKALNLDHVVHFVDRVPHEEAIRLTRASDMVLICAGIGDKTRPGWLLSKLFEYLGCRIPILAICREGEMAQIIRDTNSGYVITSEDHKAIYTILKKEIDRKLSGEERKDFDFINVNQFEEENTMSQMIKIIEDVLDNTHR